MAGFTHELIKKTAEEMAACWYEESAHNNTFYAMYPNQRAFVARAWKKFIQHAHSALIDMLTMDDVPEEQKDQILEAIMTDRALPSQGNKIIQSYH